MTVTTDRGPVPGERPWNATVPDAEREREVGVIPARSERVGPRVAAPAVADGTAPAGAVDTACSPPDAFVVEWALARP